MHALMSILISVCLLFAVAADVGAQSLERRHLVGFDLSVWSQTTDARTEVSPGFVTTSADAAGFGGSLFYARWLSEAWAMNISVGAMAADVEATTELSRVTSETATITQILVGGSYYFPTHGSSVKPLLRAKVGPFIGNQNRSEVGMLTVINENRTETAIGGQVGIGVDFIAGRHFLAGVSAAYNLMTDFDRPIGGSRNYSGPIFIIEFGYLFGAGT